MYQLNNQLPAPYELNQQQPQSFAKGGRPGHKKMVIAHMNPKELEVLDHLQGGAKRCSKTGVRTYEHLEELLKNPHITAGVHAHARHHHAMGGSTYGTPELEHLAAGGINGDTELASIGPNTHHLFDQLAGHKTINPNDGHPEYWSLGGALGGLWNTVKGGASSLWNGVKGAVPGIAKAALPALGNMATSALGNRFGGIGSAIGKMGTNLAHQGLDSLTAGSEPNPYASGIGRGLGTMAQGLSQGQGLQQAAGRGLMGASGGFGNSAIGQGMRSFGQGLQQGKGFGNSMMQGANTGLNAAGGAGNMASSMYNAAKQNGGGYGDMAQSGINHAANQFMAKTQRPQSQEPVYDEQAMQNMFRDNDQE